MLFRFFGESFRNMIIAFVWPVFIIRFSPEWGVVILAVAYVVFAKLIKAPLAAWLFHDDESAGETRSASSEVPNDY
jgi:hypothetical protein